MNIAPLCETDYESWLPLWNANNEDQCPPEVTTETWRRCLDPQSPVHGLGAHDEDGQLVGILHYVLHPTTGQLAPVCYMQDVFVDPAHRRQGIAHALVEELTRSGTQENWARIYWLAEEKNEAAQNLYKTLGIKLHFSLHVLPL